MTAHGADELRVRHYLRALHARPLGHQDPAMTTPPDAPPPSRPISPTRIIPAGAPLPARPPAPDDIPPWRLPPPAWPDPPHDLIVHHVHEVLLVAEPEPEPTPPLWARLWDRLATWRMLAAILAAVLPWAGGQSPVGVWARTVHQARTEAGIGAAYVIALVALAAAWALDRHTGRVVPRALLVTAALGATGAVAWWDPILMLTGVTR